jgi:hypothetical protein
MEETRLKLKGKGIVWSKVKLLNGGNHCYPVLNKTTIHKIVINDLKDTHFQHWKQLEWDGVIGNLVIGHLDDNVYNFNRSNLMWIPKKLNLWMRKDITYQDMGNGKWRAQLRVGKTINTARYSTQQAALHAKSNPFDSYNRHSKNASGSCVGS